MLLRLSDAEALSMAFYIFRLFTEGNVGRMLKKDDDTLKGAEACSANFDTIQSGQFFKGNEWSKCDRIFTWNNQMPSKVSQDALEDDLIKKSGYVKIRMEETISLESIMQSLEDTLKNEPDKVMYKDINFLPLENFSEQLVMNIKESKKLLDQLNTKNIIKNNKNTRASERNNTIHSKYKKFNMNNTMEKSGQYVIWKCSEKLLSKLFHLGQHLSNKKFTKSTFGGGNISGVSSPWVYIGLNHPRFPAHLEDLLFAGWNLQVIGKFSIHFDLTNPICFYLGIVRNVQVQNLLV